MILTRWNSAEPPAPIQIRAIFENEGLVPEIESLPAHSTIRDHRHPFDEVRIVLEGRLIVNVMGNELLLRPGVRIEISSNTRHSKTVHGVSACLSAVAKRAY